MVADIVVLGFWRLRGLFEFVFGYEFVWGVDFVCWVCVVLVVAGFNSVVIDVCLRGLLHVLFICLHVLLSLVVVLLCGLWLGAGVVVWGFGFVCFVSGFDLLTMSGRWVFWLWCFCSCI